MSVSTSAEPIDSPSRVVGIVVSRVGGDDGVSLEVMHWIRLHRRRGRAVHVIAGALEHSEELRALEAAGVGFSVIPEADPSPRDVDNQREFAALFDPARRDLAVLEAAVWPRVARLERELARWLDTRQIELLQLENFTLPFHHYALGAAAAALVTKRRIPTVARGHDFPDDREAIYHFAEAAGTEQGRAALGAVRDLTERVFLPQPFVTHVAINSRDQERCYPRRGIDAERVEVIPNAIDVADARLAPLSPARATQLRSGLLGAARSTDGLEHSRDFVAVAPVRPVGRKRLDVALALLKLASRRGLAETSRAEGGLTLLVTHPGTDAPVEELRALERFAALSPRVNLAFAAAPLAALNQELDPGARFTTWDLYKICDVALYFSDFEGYGNALLEVLACGLPTFVNAYEIFRRDLLPRGFDLPRVELPSSSRYGDFVADPLGYFQTHPVGRAVTGQLEALLAPLESLIALKHQIGVGAQLPAGPWRERAERMRALVAENNGYERVGALIDEAIRRACEPDRA